VKILQLIQKPQLRGAEMFACQLSNQLVQAGHEVHLVSLLEGDATLPFEGNHIRLNRPLNKRFVDVTGWKALAQHINKIKPDVVQANAGDTLKYAVLSKLLFRWQAPIVFRNASMISLYIKSPWVKVWNTFLIKQLAYVVSVSEKSKLDFVSLFPFVQRCIKSIPIGIDLKEVSRSDSTTEYIIHVGGFTFEKNHKRLLHIFKQVKESNPQLQLWLVGDGPLRLEIEEYAKALQLSDSVKFLGYRTNVLELIAGAKMLVLPSIIEGLPGVILEAMYCNTPVVAYDVGGISEVVKSNETGWLVKAGDEDGFVKAVQEALSMSQQELQQITDHAYELVVREYDNKVIAKRFVEVYTTVIARNREGMRAE
jgi:L-malate glycosyltransferase